MDSKCPVTTEAYILKQTEVPYRRVEFCWNTKLQGANLNLAKWEKSHGVVLNQILNNCQIDRSHLHIYVIFNHQRAYQDAYFAAPYAVSPHPTCINHKKNHVDW